jgi:hypothetical protein
LFKEQLWLSLTSRFPRFPTNSFVGVNTGVNSVCKSCSQNSRECTYPVAGSIPTPKRSDAAAGIKQEDGESKKRIRTKVEDNGRRNSAKSAEGPLDSPVLTKKVWDELYAIFKLHFSTEMPFLHPPSFRVRFRQVAYPRDPSLPAVEVPEGKLLLLGVLALTARYHHELVTLHGDPLAASEYYAEALQTSFSGPISKMFTFQSLEVVQAALMLSLYEWGQTRGLTAWMYVGNAIRLAQSMGLPYEDDDGPLPYSSPPRHDSNNNGTASELITDKEVRRRTWWSCFVMDRMLAAGKCRPTMIDVEKLRVQLPCSDDQFLFPKTATRTDVLKANFKRADNEPVNKEGVLGWYIRLVEIFGRLSVWSYSGGRRIETEPPWSQSTKFFQIRQDLETFRQALPPSLSFTAENLSAHTEKNPTAYASMHTLYSLCLILLHREYFPFIPLACKGPNGPLDEPTFPPSKFPPPKDFWKDSAETVFKAAKDIIEIVTTLRDENALPESAQIGFAVFQAGFVCIYSSHFGNMDTARYVHPSSKHLNKSWTDTAAELVKSMVPRLKMMKKYQVTLQKTDEFFEKASAEYHDHIAGAEKPASFSGGGADQYKSRERELKEYGGLSDPADRRSRASTDDATVSTNGDAIAGVETPRSTGWKTVNMSDADERLKYEVPLGYSALPSGYNQHYPTGLVPINNGLPSPILNPSYSNGATPHYSHTQAHQHATSYPSSITHHAPQPGMAPPPQQSDLWSLEERNQWLRYHNKLDWSSQFDNFGQDASMANAWPCLQPNSYAQAIQNVNGWDPDRVPSPS